MFENGKRTIGMFACKTQEYFQRTVCKAMAEQAKQWDYNLIIFSTFGEYDNNQEYIAGECNMLEIPCYKKLDAVVLLLDTFDIPQMEERLLHQLEEHVSCPVISIRKKQESCINILSNDKEAVSHMVNHMVDCHQAKKIYYVTGPSTMYDIMCREEGFRETVRKRGLDFCESYIYTGNLWYNAGEQAVDYFLALSDELPDAIICANDYMAISVCEELNKRGINVPEDIKVMGFDDVIEARELYPQISTVCVKPEDFAAKAMEVIRLHDSGCELMEEYYIGSNNLYRDSCGCTQSGKELVTMFRQLSENNRKLIHLGKQNTFMVFRMECINEYGQLPDLIGKFVEGNEGVRHFFICLNEDEQYENKTKTGLPFTDRMNMAIHAHYNGGPNINVDMPGELFDRTELLPINFLESGSQIYYVNPMHYREHCFGYALISFEHHQFQECGDFYQAFLVNLSSVLQTIWVQRHIQKLNEERLHLLRYDRETSLFNQYGFFEASSDWRRNAIKNNEFLSFLCIRITNLQEIIERFGWSEREDVIGAVTKAIRQTFQEENASMTGRTGENEFCIVIKNSSREKLNKVKARFLMAVNQINLKWDKEYFVETSSGGVAQKMSESISVEECIRRAQVKINQDTRGKDNMQKYSNEAVQFIRHNYYRDLNVQDIADSIGITRAYLSTCFKSAYQLSVQEYMTEYRLGKAKEMLADSDLKIKEIAFYTGYRDELYFSKAFKKKYGMSPRSFRQQMEKASKTLQ